MNPGPVAAPFRSNLDASEGGHGHLAGTLLLTSRTPSVERDLPCDSPGGQGSSRGFLVGERSEGTNANPYASVRGHGHPVRSQTRTTPSARTAADGSAGGDSPGGEVGSQGSLVRVRLQEAARGVRREWSRRLARTAEQRAGTGARSRSSGVEGRRRRKRRKPGVTGVGWRAPQRCHPTGSAFCVQFKHQRGAPPPLGVVTRTKHMHKQTHQHLHATGSFTRDDGTYCLTVGQGPQGNSAARSTGLRDLASHPFSKCKQLAEPLWNEVKRPETRSSQKQWTGCGWVLLRHCMPQRELC